MTFCHIKRQSIYINFSGTMLDYLGLVHSLPNEWKNRQRKSKEPNPVIHPNIQNIISHKRGNKHIYNMLIYSKYKDVSNTWESGWVLCIVLFFCIFQQTFVSKRKFKYQRCLEELLFVIILSFR